MGVSRKITVVNSKGLHARPAASFVKLANTFNSRIRIKGQDKDVDGKSIMGVMMLAAGRGSSLEIMAEGEDQDEALQTLVDLVSRGFDEQE